ncbi:MFS transporter [Phenylobacterium sp.]|uniref:MFS transporter n=1 Tax=Phenylobacterium sp. TaxID=1871053 RepID=UPI0025CC10B7|nr:MFS transporter [Phenylobacterium sp.]
MSDIPVTIDPDLSRAQPRSAADGVQATAARQVYPPAPVAMFGVFILFLIYASSFIDRQIMSLLVGPIRTDLNLTDTQFSLLHGLAFALLYATLGIPVGRWVDRGNRSLIIAGGVAIWSVLTVLCGYSRNFVELFLARVGVGVGEATAIPVTYSLMGDYYPPEQRGLALGVFASGSYVGMGGALVAGGLIVGALSNAGPIQLPLLGSLEPWRFAFFVVGAPGLLLGLMALMLYEPRRGRQKQAAAARVPWSAARQHYRSAFRGVAAHHLTGGLLAMALYAMLAWAPEHARREFGIPAGQAGLVIGSMIILFGTLGAIAAGAASDALIRRGVVAARMVVFVTVGLGAIPGSLVFALGPNPAAALAGLALCTFCLSACSSLGPAGVLELNPPGLRGLGSAIYQLVVALVGFGCGPTIVAATSDFIIRGDGDLSLPLAVTVPVMLLAGATAALAGIKPYKRALKLAADWK